MNSVSSAHLRSIQALRAIAAIAVMVFHLTDGRWVLGAAGVDIFFVISGYLMGLLGSQLRPLQFFARRAIRIIPLYWAITLVYFVAAKAGLFSRLTVTPGELLGSLLFIPYFNAEGQVWPIVVPGWTLNYEMLFYAVFSLGLVSSRPLPWSLAGLAALVLCGVMFRPTDAVLLTWTSSILLEFVFGIAISQFRLFPGAAAGLVLVVAGGLLFLLHPQSEGGEFRLFVWGVPAAFVVLGALSIERSGRWPALMRPLEAVGDMSYSVYLLHGLIIAAVKRRLPGIPGDIAATLLVFAASWASYRFVESTSRRWLNRKLAFLVR